MKPYGGGKKYVDAVVVMGGEPTML